MERIMNSSHEFLYNEIVANERKERKFLTDSSRTKCANEQRMSDYLMTAYQQMYLLAYTYVCMYIIIGGYIQKFVGGI